MSAAPLSRCHAAQLSLHFTRTSTTTTTERIAPWNAFPSFHRRRQRRLLLPPSSPSTTTATAFSNLVMQVRGGGSGSERGGDPSGYYYNGDNLSNDYRNEKRVADDYYYGEQEETFYRQEDEQQGDDGRRYQDNVDDYYYDDRGLRRSPASLDDYSSSVRPSFSSRNLPSIIRNGDRKIGLTLLALGSFFTVSGIFLFFHKTLLKLGNLLFIAGVPMTIGPGRTAGYFLQPRKMRATAFLAIGIFLVFVGWPIVGMALEIFGLLNLFGNMIPMAMVVLKQMPIVGGLFKAVGSSGSTKQRNHGRRNDGDNDRDYYESYNDNRDDRYYYRDNDDQGGDADDRFY